MLSESPYLDYFAKLISERSVSRHTDDLVYPFRLALGSIGWTVGARPLFLYFSTEDLSVSRLASLDFLFFVSVWLVSEAFALLLLCGPCSLY